ncbi:MAG: hypothetical protein LBD84_07370 [Campylobacteraceae bacterium]|jgi:hypothetical protein|nr:hypothetical protein [Campylobacteraceae bacterium]
MAKEPPPPKSLTKRICIGNFIILLSYINFAEDALLLNIQLKRGYEVYEWMFQIAVCILYRQAKMTFFLKAKNGQ